MSKAGFLKACLEEALCFPPNTGIKAWEMAIQKVIEEMFPEKNWYDVTRVSIFNKLLAGKAPVDVCEMVWQDLEKMMESEKGTVAILQLAHFEEHFKRRFVSFDQLQRITKETPDVANYELVHLKEIPKESLEDKKRACSDLYIEFNADCLRPADYYGHSLSVSDVIVLYDGKEEFSSFYVDDIGFNQLPDNFLSDDMKEKISSGFDVRKELHALEVLGEKGDLSDQNRKRKENLAKGYTGIFKMADERAVLLAKQEASNKGGLDSKIEAARGKADNGKEYKKEPEKDFNR